MFHVHMIYESYTMVAYTHCSATVKQMRNILLYMLVLKQMGCSQVILGAIII